MISGLKERAAGILGEFNTKPEILLDAVFGEYSSTGDIALFPAKEYGNFEKSPDRCAAAPGGMHILQGFRFDL